MWAIFQCLHDLRAVSKACSLARPDLCQLQCAQLFACIEAHETDANAATFALCEILAELLEGGVGFDAPDQNWAQVQGFIRTLPKPRRTAILRTFLLLHERARFGVAPFADLGDTAPEAYELTSATPTQLIPALCQIARTLSPADMKIVAKADYETDVDAHFAGLKRTLADLDCRFPKGDNWVPGEVVELQAHVPDATGFLQCSALLIANRIHQPDHWDQYEFRWMNTGRAIQAQMPDHARTLQQGVRYLYERDFAESWDPDWPKKNFATRAIAIPYYDLYA